jgi:hypothetical protein
VCAACVPQLQQVVGDRPFICVKSSKDTRYAHFWATTHGGKSVRCVPFHSLAEFKAHMGFRWHKLQVGGACTGQWVGGWMGAGGIVHA